MDFFWQNGENLNEERHGADVVVVPEGGGDTEAQVCCFTVTASEQDQRTVNSYFSKSV